MLKYFQDAPYFCSSNHLKDMKTEPGAASCARCSNQEVLFENGINIYRRSCGARCVDCERVSGNVVFRGKSQAGE